MRNLKKLGCFVSLTRCKPLELYLTTRGYSQYCYNSYTPRHNVSTCTLIFKNDKLFMQKEVSFSNVLLSRSISSTIICCAKGKDRGGKEKKKPKSSKVDLRELSEVIDVDDLTSQMNKPIEDMKIDFIKNLTIRSTTGSIEHIPLKVDGKEYQLQELAQIARKPKLIVLNVSAFPAAIPHIIKAIEKSGLNINPQQDGTTIFLPIPKVTKEHRENLSKNAKAIFIKYRDEIKDIKNKSLKNLKKKKDVSEDTIHRAEAQVQTLCDKYLKEAELVLETKQNELLGYSD